MKWKRLMAASMAGVLLAGMPLGHLLAANNSNIIPYTANYDQEAYPQQNTEAVFTTAQVDVDGVMDAAYGEARVSEIKHLKMLKDYEYEEGEEPYGMLRTLWDGPVLYLLVDVYDNTPERGAPGSTGGKIGNPKDSSRNDPIKLDGVAFGFDLYNDKVMYETDTIGSFVIGSNGALYYFRNDNIPSLGSVMADEIHPEYQNRIKDYAAQDIVDEETGNVIGYTVELALQLEGLPLVNGTTVGMEVEIHDVADPSGARGRYLAAPASISGNDIADGEYVVTGDISDGNNDGPLEVQDVSSGDGDVSDGNSSNQGNGEPTVQKPAANTVMAADTYADVVFSRVANVFWSHDQDSLYADMDHERPNALDWGNITLTGWNGTDPFAYSDWRLTNAVRYLDSISFPKGVYTPASQQELDSAREQAELVIAAGLGGRKDITASNQAADRLEAAIAGLRWADTRYPDPDELPHQMTLPNPYRFFGSDRVVEDNEDWQERRSQLLDMAQFYEYGYKPGTPDGLAVSAVKRYEIGEMKPGGWWPVQVTCPTYDVTLDITVGEKTSSLTYSVYLPTQEQLQASGRTDGPLPVVLSYDGDSAVYRNAGFAVVQVPPGSGGDRRTNEYAWGTRTGCFYELYPYSRNGEGALKEVSSEMAAAWSATRVIDALEGKADIRLAEESDKALVSEIASAIDVDKLAVTGFSINGKYAFVAAVFDERIDVCIPAAAGASGPSPWRYVYTGQVHDWTGTLFAAGRGQESFNRQVAFGTEFMANSIRHNRVRETELFRQFMTPGNFYERLPGAYGYGTRLPYDQNDLVATLAPRAVLLENTVNDYNDGCVADSLALQIAKSVYRNLGYDADNLVKFNQRPVVTAGDPHGSDNAQKARSAEYLNYYFYGAAMSESTENWLNTDPFNLKVSNNRTQSPYDYYYGGFNTITGGTGGVEGRDGWYYYNFPEKPEEPEKLDPTGLQTSLDKAKAIKASLSGYLLTGQEEFLKTLESAVAVLQNAKTQAELDDAQAKLDAAMEQLRKKVTSGELEELYQSLKDKDLSEYTEESAKDFQVALDMVSALLNGQLEDTAENQKLLADAYALLTQADEKLEKKPTQQEPGGSEDDDDDEADTSDNQDNGQQPEASDASVRKSPKTADHPLIAVLSIIVITSFGVFVYAAARSMDERRKSRR